MPYVEGTMSETYEDFLREHVKVITVTVPTKVRCPECGRVFDLTDETDSAEWHYGHDCEEV